MTTTKRRSPVSTTVAKASVDQATLTLKDLPEKPKEDLPLREAVEQLHGDITAALSKGYSHEDVAALLSAQGVDISTSSLRYYLARLGKKKAAPTQAKTRRPRQSKDKLSAVSEQDEASNDAASLSVSASEEVLPSTAPDLSEPSAPAKKRTPRSTTQTRTKAPERTSSRAAAKTKPSSKTSSVRSRKKV